jgi:hypothetical protein
MQQRVAVFVGIADRAESLAWCLVLLIIAFGTGLLGIKWRTEALAVAIGFAIITVGGTIASWLFNLWGFDYARALSNLNSFIYVAIICAWIAVFRAQGSLRQGSAQKDSLTSSSDP